MADDLKAGDRVSWNSHGAKAHGKVVKNQTSETEIKSQLIVETKEGKRAAHKPGALTKQ